MLVKFSWGGFVNTSPRRGLYTVVISLPWIGRHWLLHQHYNSKHKGHMWSRIPVDLFVHTSSHNGNSDHWLSPHLVFEENERGCLDCARPSSLCVVESRYLRKLLSFVPRSSLQGNRKEAGSMQRLQHPDRHLISSRNPGGLRGLPRFWITRWNVLSIITSCAIDACCTHSAQNL